MNDATNNIRRDYRHLAKSLIDCACVAILRLPLISHLAVIIALTWISTIYSDSWWSIWLFTWSCSILGLVVAVHALSFRFRTDRIGFSSVEDLKGSPILDAIYQQFEKNRDSATGELAALREQSEMLLDRYRILTENLAAAVVIRDSQSKLTYCSPYTELLTGYSLSEIYSSNDDFFQSIIHDQDRELYKRALHYVQVGEPFEFRYRFFHKTGIEMWAETRTVPILDDHGEIVSSLSITLDATRTVRQQLQVEEKNRDLEDFAYMISHDLKAPVFTIKGMLSVLKEDYGEKLPEDGKSALEHLSQAAKRIEQLIAAVLQYSKISSAADNNETVDLQLVLKEIEQEYRQRLNDCGGAIDIAPGLPAVAGDALKLYQIFSNLIDNAIKYRSKEPLRIDVQLLVVSNPKQVRIRVKDNGLGIPQNKIDSIFRPFHRVHTDVEGTGVGLASVKKLLEKIGGAIEVSSQEGSGSSFVVTLRRQ